MDPCNRLLLSNRAWAAERLTIHPDYFTRTVATQTPQFLWIGCSDSRVPVEELTNSEPGDLFVHRNIANLVVENDTNLLSVLQYAVDVLKVMDVIVCGHYNCGGVKAAKGPQLDGPIGGWLKNLRDLYAAHRDEIEALPDEQARWDRFVDINVADQVRNLANTNTIRSAWAKENRPTIHGWVYDLRTGHLNELLQMQPSALSPTQRTSPPAAAAGRHA
jgi:carbonic anhydrase